MKHLSIEHAFQHDGPFEIRFGLHLSYQALF